MERVDLFFVEWKKNKNGGNNIVGGFFLFKKVMKSFHHFLFSEKKSLPKISFVYTSPSPSDFSTKNENEKFGKQIFRARWSVKKVMVSVFWDTNESSLLIFLTKIQR